MTRAANEPETENVVSLAQRRIDPVERADEAAVLHFIGRWPASASSVVRMRDGGLDWHQILPKLRQIVRVPVML